MVISIMLQFFQMELKSWERYWVDKTEKSANILDSLEHADENFFPNIRVLLIFGCVSPITGRETERSFSALGYVEKLLRSRMAEERLAGLTVMAVHFRKPSSSILLLLWSGLFSNSHKNFCHLLVTHSKPCDCWFLQAATLEEHYRGHERALSVLPYVHGWKWKDLIKSFNLAFW